MKKASGNPGIHGIPGTGYPAGYRAEDQGFSWVLENLAEEDPNYVLIQIRKLDRQSSLVWVSHLEIIVDRLLRESP